tara:strand:- start:2745 stop:3164 length:420 start_codon:yes stop_codon:yes gene_type:complete
MKKSIILLSVIGLLTLGSCNQKPDVTKMLENQATKTEIFNAITESHDYMTGFMETIQNSERAMQMMQENKMMKGKRMQMMMNDSTMMKRMMGNKNIMQHMMQHMMKDSTSMNSMIRMMHQKGMMTDKCMQSCMKIINKK